ncbi:MAG TPA: hypothetical protein VGH60_08520 [Solirubrobacteraceae bacterium]
MALIVFGALLIAEAIVSHVYRIAWSGDYGWQRVLAITLGASAIIIGAYRLWQTWNGWPSEHEIAGFARQWTPFLVAGVVYFFAFLIMAPVPEGDQPHYELESVGLAYDQTRDMTADYTRADRYRLMFPLGVPDVHAYRYKPGGELVLVHNVGLPLLLAPAVPWVREASVLSPGRQLWPWNIEIILCAALAAQLLYRILRRLRPQHPQLVVGVWASVAFSAPMVVYASQVYPEMPAVLLALIAVDALMRSPRRSTIMIGAAASALMPWLHVRLLPIAALLVLGLAIRAFAAVPGEERRTAAGVRSAAWAIVPLLLSLVVMAIAFQHWYGSPLPSAQYRLAQTRQPQTVSASWATLTGGFWSATRGWLPYAPVCILALASIGYTVRRYRLWALFGLAVAGVYLLNLTIQGSDPGFSFAGRYTVILMPFAAIPLLIAVADIAPVRWVFWSLALCTLYLALAIVFEPPPTVAGVPGVTGPGYSPLLWSWFVHIWPEVIPNAAHFYPDAGTVLAWSAALLAVSVAGYFVRPSETRSLTPVAR